MPAPLVPPPGAPNSAPIVGGRRRRTSAPPPSLPLPLALPSSPARPSRPLAVSGSYAWYLRGRRDEVACVGRIEEAFSTDKVSKGVGKTTERMV
eukprot:358515-Chlamydomonas_euryale.AAC.3